MRKMAKVGSVLLLAVSFFAAGCVGGAGSPSGMAAELSPDQRFTLVDLNGQTVSLDGLLKEKKAVLVNFWATWCPPCREEIPDLIRLQRQYAARGFTALGVNVGESQGKVSAFAAKMGINYPVLLDEDQSVAENFRIVGIPTSLLVDSSGKILGEYHSASPQLFSDVEKALAA
ncbi:MAG: TlpA family protein disulfide reductase [Candidatus Omnitrophica bacterium]|nr:TlpA family protein disulfide reductase [Candidatus Omnitrophota bacterium]